MGDGVDVDGSSTRTKVKPGWRQKIYGGNLHVNLQYYDNWLI
jgi:hypothetical protein